MRLFLHYLVISFFFITPNKYLKAEKINVVNFKLISTENGLSQKSVKKIFQDTNGFIWLGTQEGLNRYDGRVFEHFRHDELNQETLSGDVIRDITEDSNKNIWVATSSGLNLFIPSTKTFKRIQIYNENNQAVLRLNTLFENSIGELFVGTDGNGIFQIVKTGHHYSVKRSKLFPTLTNFDIRVIFEDSRNRYWVGSDGDGVWLKDIEPLRLLSKDSSHSRIMSITEDQKGQIWMGTLGEGLNRFNERTLSFQNFQFDPNDDTSLSNNRIYKILEDSNGSLWIATDKGINLFNPSLENFTRIINFPSQQFSLIHNRVLDIFEDRNGLIWIGTLAGLNLWNPVDAKFVQYQHISENNRSLSNNTVSAFTENQEGDIYAATFGGGLNKIDSRTLQITPISQNLDLHDQRLTALMTDQKNNLWIGSATSGVRLFNTKLKTLNSFRNINNDKESISSNAITNIFEDSDGEVWISTYGAGLNRFRKETNTFKRYSHDPSNTNSLASNDVYQIFEDDEGFIWLATAGGGLSRLDKHTENFTNFKSIKSQPDSLPTNTAWSITQDRKGRFWVGTQGMGLIRWEPEDRRQGRHKFKNYSIQSGLPSSTVNGVVEDQEGYLWISTNKGVSRLNPDNDTFIHYNLADSIHHNEFIQGAVLKAKDDRIYIGGLNGISAFYPKEITINKNVPKVLLTKIMSENKQVLFNSPLAQLEKVNFSHNDYFLTFEFAALDYAQPNLNQYQYKLEGFDNDWIQSGNLNRATYTNLPSGKYTFKVKGSNNDGVWSDESINLEVTIEPAPWLSWWAFTIYTTIFCVLLIIFIRSQAKRIASQDLFQKQVSDQIENKTLELEQTNLVLKNKLDEYQNSSGLDLATGMYNQAFFTEQLSICLNWFKSTKVKDDTKIFCAILQLKHIKEELTDKVLIQLNDMLNDSGDLSLVARWSNKEIALLSIIKSDIDKTNIIDYIHHSCKELNLLDENSDPIQIAIGYSVNPIHYNDDEILKWENILMLTEHAMRSAACYDKEHFIGLVRCHRKLSPNLIKEIMASQSILELNDIFEFDTDI